VSGVITHAPGFRYDVDREAGNGCIVLEMQCLPWSEPHKTSHIFRAREVISLCPLFGAGAGGSDMIFPLRAADVLALAAPKQGGGSNYRIVKVLRFKV
jgi:hypothetical protein